MDVIFAIIVAAVIIRFALPFFYAFEKAVKDEADRISREGLIKTENGAFWSPDQELRTHKH